MMSLRLSPGPGWLSVCPDFDRRASFADGDRAGLLSSHSRASLPGDRANSPTD